MFSCGQYSKDLFSKVKKHLESHLIYMAVQQRLTHNILPPSKKVQVKIACD